MLEWADRGHPSNSRSLMLVVTARTCRMHSGYVFRFLDIVDELISRQNAMRRASAKESEYFEALCSVERPMGR